ncbi:17770_t:CDS:2, partial [Cetraspora pellucida]
MNNTDMSLYNQERKLCIAFWPTPATLILISTITANNQKPETQFNLLIKTYIDKSIHALIITIITSIKHQMNPNISSLIQDNSSTSLEYEKLLQRLQRPIDSFNNTLANNLALTSKEKKAANSSDKYSPISVLNDLIMRASKVTIQDQSMATIISPMSLHLFKSTLQKYSSLNYFKFKGIYDIRVSSTLILQKPKVYRS